MSFNIEVFIVGRDDEPSKEGPPHQVELPFTEVECKETEKCRSWKTPTSTINRTASWPTGFIPIKQYGLSVLIGKNITTFLAAEFDASYSLSGVYGLLYRLSFSRIRTRPQYEKSNPELLAKWIRKALLTKVNWVKQTHSDKRIEFWSQDEMRYANKTRITAEWQISG